MIAYNILKIAISALLIVVIAAVAKKSSLLGGLLASIPLISYMAIVWLYVDTKSVAKVASLSTDVFWLVLPSLVFFIMLPVLLKHHLGFALAMAIATLLMFIAYGLMVFALKQF